MRMSSKSGFSSTLAMKKKSRKHTPFPLTVVTVFSMYSDNSPSNKHSSKAFILPSRSPRDSFLTVTAVDNDDDRHLGIDHYPQHRPSRPSSQYSPSPSSQYSQHSSPQHSHRPSSQYSRLRPLTPSSRSNSVENLRHAMRQAEALQQGFEEMEMTVSPHHSPDSSNSSTAISRRRSFANIPREEYAALPPCFIDCPMVMDSLQLPVPTPVREYLAEPDPKVLEAMPVLPYPLRVRQPVTRRIERSHMFDQHPRAKIINTTKRHSLASGQIDRLVHANRETLTPPKDTSLAYENIPWIPSDIYWQEQLVDPNPFRHPPRHG
ncbi:uncharacterized protein BYT42DRAFT_98686 [Radiomyces spectabilis]|uniref:uncharacterized protein n=1 Tax=Radiomyces spectabilis TaxID=64574 RepID=UPI00222121FD|nr:uncharacterized protein BYT42DRAFT_98686 [Radiomyces spectabilis]KAI8370677.1 hypothetical protein BYT42DRAFT_98686 [Radiomyces spectabilis]